MIPQELIFGLLLFFIYINDLSDDLMTNFKLFGNDIFIFFCEWAILMSMIFNSDPRKQAQEVTFSKKCQNPNHDSIHFNHNLVQQFPSQKYIRMYLDTKLNFQEHFHNTMTKVDKNTGLLHTLQAVLPRPYLVTIYKAFIRPQFDYDDIIYGQVYKKYFIKSYKQDNIKMN